MMNLCLRLAGNRPNDDFSPYPAKERSFRFPKNALIFQFVLFFLAATAFAQDNAVTGKVSDGTGGGLPGVTVKVKGTTQGTNTDMDGNFTVNAAPTATLVFSYIGFSTQEIPVGNQSTINITMSDDVKALEEIVVVGYGTAKRKDVTGSVQSVTSKDFNSGINPNPLQAIQGKVAGLVITQPNGDPNTNPTVRLRGYTSLAGGSDPLYVVDGIIGVPINTISPNDIESMDVLKDASASAIYGSRAANGVIIITTKRGKSGRTTVSFNNYVGADVISNRLDLLDGPGYISEVKRIKGDASLSDNLRFPKPAAAITTPTGGTKSRGWATQTTTIWPFRAEAPLSPTGVQSTTSTARESSRIRASTV